MKVISWILIFSILLWSCATTPPPPTSTQKTQLQIREFQTRTYDTNDEKIAMKAILNAFQDEGFIVKNANNELGLLTAEKEIDIEVQQAADSTPEEDNSKKVWGCIALAAIVAAIVAIVVIADKGKTQDDDDDDDHRGGDIRYGDSSHKEERKDQIVIIESSANVTVRGSQTKVRVNFQQKVLDNMGATVRVNQIEDAQFYQDFFSKVDKSIFLQKEKL